MSENYDAVTQSQLQMAQAFGRLANAVTGALTMQLSTTAALEATIIPSATEVIQVYGTATVGDGGAAVYIRSSTVTAVQSADGQYWTTASGGYFIKTGSVGGGGLTVDVETTVMSQPLTAGTWDINLVMTFANGSGGDITSAYCKINTNPATGSYTSFLAAPCTAGSAVLPACRFILTTDATARGIVAAHFTSGPVTISAGFLQCRGV